LTVLGKTHELFQICDLEGKGFITCQDMQEINFILTEKVETPVNELLSSLPQPHECILPTHFSLCFFSKISKIIFAARPMSSCTGAAGGETACTFTCEETMSEDEDEEFQFSNLMNQLGAKKVLDDESDVKRLWLQLRKDEPHLLSSFEELLVRIFSQLQAAENEKNELECILKKRIAAYDEEIQHLYEEVEQQIKKEKEQFLLKDAERFQSYSKELECKLLSKEEEMEQLVQNQK
ncbi:EF-hand calcium-binding domain-containing protein 4B, partial [Dryobates pubescens]